MIQGRKKEVLSGNNTDPACLLLLLRDTHMLSTDLQGRILKRHQCPAFTLEGKVSAVSRGDDSGVVTSLSGEQKPGWLSPATLQLSQASSSGSVSWQTENSLAESWSTVGDVGDPDDTKSPDHLTEEHSENHSSVSDMVHLERDEDDDEEILADDEVEERSLGEEEEEEEELQASVMSVLGGEREMVELREDELAVHVLPRSSDVASHQHAQQTSDEMMSVGRKSSVEDPAEVSHATTASMPMPVWKLQPPSASSTPVPSTPTLAEIHSELRYSLQEQLHPPPVLGRGAPQPPETIQTVSQPESLLLVPKETEGVPPLTQEVQLEKTNAETAISSPDNELSVLLYGGAALVAILGFMAYVAVVYCRK
ncbi:hypothetical protein UPYG_G00346670 [Umbra pygmaea]|uniref:Bcl-2-like protein 13 n=1 Tax=Umbra pygmaea TaxID=75934 RepID=A0ABD0VXR7_UMBPY